MLGQIRRSHFLMADGGAGFGVAQKEFQRGTLDRNERHGARREKFGWIHIHVGCRPSTSGSGGACGGKGLRATTTAPSRSGSDAASSSGSFDFRFRKGG